MLTIKSSTSFGTTSAAFHILQSRANEGSSLVKIKSSTDVLAESFETTSIFNFLWFSLYPKDEASKFIKTSSKTK